MVENGTHKADPLQAREAGVEEEDGLLRVGPLSLWEDLAVLHGRTVHPGIWTAVMVGHFEKCFSLLRLQVADLLQVYKAKSMTLFIASVLNSCSQQRYNIMI